MCTNDREWWYSKMIQLKGSHSKLVLMLILVVVTMMPAFFDEGIGIGVVEVVVIVVWIAGIQILRFFIHGIASILLIPIVAL